MMHLEGSITADRGGMEICRTSELHNQGLKGAFSTCKSFRPEGAILTGRGFLAPKAPPLDPSLVYSLSFQCCQIKISQDISYSKF